MAGKIPAGNKKQKKTVGENTKQGKDLAGKRTTGKRPSGEKSRGKDRRGKNLWGKDLAPPVTVSFVRAFVRACIESAGDVFRRKIAYYFFF